MVNGSTADGSGDAKDPITPPSDATAKADAAPPHLSDAKPDKGSRRDRKKQRREGRNQAAPVVSDAAAGKPAQPTDATAATGSAEAAAPVDSAPDVIGDAPAAGAHAGAVDSAPDVIGDAPTDGAHAAAVDSEPDVIGDAPAAATVHAAADSAVDSEPDVVGDAPADGAHAAADSAVDSEPDVVGDGPAEAPSGLVIDMTADDAGDDEEAPTAIAPELMALAERLRAGRAVLCAGARLGSGEIRTFRATVDKVLAALPAGDASRGAPRPRPSPAGRRRLRPSPPRRSLRRRAAAGVDADSRAVRRRSPPRRAAVPRRGDDDLRTTPSSAPSPATARCRASIRRTITSRSPPTARRASSSRRSAIRRAPRRSSGRPRICRPRWPTAAIAASPTISIARAASCSSASTGEIPISASCSSACSPARRSGDVEHYAVIPGLGAIEKEELYAAYRIRVLDADDVVALALALKATVGNAGPALPDDDDFEGWLALLTEEPARADAHERLDALDDQAARARRLGEAGRPAAGPRRRRDGGGAVAPSCSRTSAASSSTASAICRARSRRASPPTRSIRGPRPGTTSSGWRRRPACGTSCSASWPRSSPRCPTASARRRGCGWRGSTATS